MALATHVNDLPEPVLAAILALLDARDLARCTGVCKLWRCLASKDACANKVWRRYYTQRWMAGGHDRGLSWHARYGSKMQQIKAWAGRYQVDQLLGHTASVRACKLLPSHKLLATGSLDRTVRLWDLSSGMPISTSRPLGGTVRCIAMSSHALAAGVNDHTVRVWLPQDGDDEEDDTIDAEFCLDEDDIDVSIARQKRGSAALFDLPSPATLCLRGHTGPVSSLCLTEEALYSGSWDYCVRIWSCDSWECTGVLTFDDWVGPVVARGPQLLVAAGPCVYVNDTHTGAVTRKFQDLHEGHVTALDGTHNGRMMFTGSSDGLVLAHDLRMRDATVVVWHHKGTINSLSYEDPWLATASGDGTALLVNMDRYRSNGTGTINGVTSAGIRSINPLYCRQFQTAGGAACCVDLADQYMAAGCESGHVRMWDFTKAVEAAERAAQAKAVRQAARLARQQAHQHMYHQHHHQQASMASSSSPQQNYMMQHMHGNRLQSRYGNSNAAVTHGSGSYGSSPGSHHWRGNQAHTVGGSGSIYHVGLPMAGSPPGYGIPAAPAHMHMVGSYEQPAWGWHHDATSANAQTYGSPADNSWQAVNHGRGSHASHRRNGKQRNSGQQQLHVPGPVQQATAANRQHGQQQPGQQRMMLLQPNNQGNNARPQDLVFSYRQVNKPRNGGNRQHH